VIGEVVRGDHMPDLVSYLFGPGRHDEHVDQHLVAGYADAVFSAPDRLWQSEPGVQRQVRGEARELGWELEYPHSRWQSEVPRGYVWHCSLSVKAGEGQLTDAQWSEAAHAVVSAIGCSGDSGKASCRWVAVRHGLSAEGNDHVHIAVNLVREDGTKASPWNDYRKVGTACAELEERFGLQPVPGRITRRSVPEPSRADREISSARGDPEPLRVRLERTVRACAAAARSE
jgi:relaxase-like protein